MFVPALISVQATIRPPPLRPAVIPIARPTHTSPLGGGRLQTLHNHVSNQSNNVNETGVTPATPGVTFRRYPAVTSEDGNGKTLSTEEPYYHNNSIILKQHNDRYPILAVTSYLSNQKHLSAHDMLHFLSFSQSRNDC